MNRQLSYPLKSLTALSFYVVGGGVSFYSPAKENVNIWLCKLKTEILALRCQNFFFIVYIVNKDDNIHKSETLKSNGRTNEHFISRILIWKY